MSGEGGAGPDHARPGREALDAENARLRAVLARAGLDTERGLAETAAAQEEMRQILDAAVVAAADHARELVEGRAELAGAEALNDALRRANAALAASEERLRAVVESATDYAIISTDPQGHITGWSEGARNVLGWAESEVLCRDTALIFTPEDRAAGAPEAEMRAALENGTVADERWHVRRDGSRFWAQGQLTPLRDGSGGRRGFFKILRDRTARREADQERERLLAMLGQSQVMVCDWDGRIEVWSQGMERLFGFTAAEAVGAITWERLRSTYPEPWAEIVAALRREGRWVGEVRHRHKDGSPRIVRATWLVQPGLDGQRSSLVVSKEDQTAAKLAEARLRVERGLLDAVIRQAPVGISVTEAPSGRAVVLNDRAQALIGHGEQGEDAGRYEAYGAVHPDGRPYAVNDYPTVRALRRGEVVEQEEMLYRRDGPGGAGVTRLEVSSAPVRDGTGQIVAAVTVLADIEQQRRAEEALRRLTETLEARVAERTAERDRMWRLSTDLMVVARFDATIAAVNPAWTAQLGWTERELVGRSFMELVHPEDAAATAAETARLAQGATTLRFENRYRRKDGDHLRLSWTAVPDAGLIHAVARDVTAEKAAAEALAQAEDALRQAQKMEAVGQLTGGIAHDFNNMLQAIGGALELAQGRTERGRAAEAARYLEVARETVDRAASLTHRLLAFARRQQLQPRPVEPDDLMRGMAELIRRTVGPGIAVELRLHDGIWSVLCDPSQLENALLNLAINARDAMPDGGRLTIFTADVCLRQADVAGQEGATPGDYVEIAVSDTGSGMDEATRARAFEPFFTTKPIGQGTGLGLSQLYGFARQSGGFALLDSAPGRGTTVRLYLPRHAQAGEQETEEAASRAEAPRVAPGAVGTVLLVEDEAGVREVAAEHLRELGYRVVEVADGPKALRVLHGSRVDLLVTDVGLPGGLNGRQIAEIARERRPGLPVLFITGYAGAVLEGQLAPGTAMIGKPFTLDALAERVRTMLEATPAE